METGQGAWLVGPHMRKRPFVLQYFIPSIGKINSVFLGRDFILATMFSLLIVSLICTSSHNL